MSNLTKAFDEVFKDLRTDPYASEEETAALIKPDPRSPEEKRLHTMMDERGAWEQDANSFSVLRDIALELLTEQAKMTVKPTGKAPCERLKAAQPEQESIGREKYAAILEGHRKACEEAYFGARPHLSDDVAILKAFRHGFDSGYDVEGKQHRNEWFLRLQDEFKRLKSATPPAAQPAQQEPVYHLRQFGDVTKEQLDRYIATGDINPKPAPVVQPVQEPINHQQAASAGLREAVNRSVAIAKNTVPTLQKRPQNCGTGYCSCIECVIEPAPVQPEQRPVWVDVAIRGDMARAVFDAIRVAVPGLGPWGAFDALEVQRMADALKPFTTPPAAQLKPLTLETIKKLMPKPDSKGWIYTEAQIIETVRQVEAAHRITKGKP